MPELLKPLVVLALFAFGYGAGFLADLAEVPTPPGYVTISQP
jgi:hypothetical protein